MALGAGSKLGSLLIDESLGEGRLGTTYRASDPDQGPVVVKLLHRLRAVGAEERFLLLARRLAEVRHPSLARVLGYGVHDGVPYLVVKAAGSIPLDLRFPVGPPSIATALPILSAVAAALDHLHHLGLAHGSLAGHQILLDEYDRPTVTDFGLWPLRMMIEGAQDAFAGEAPELQGGGVPTSASDRYTFAVLAHRLLIGNPPSAGVLDRATAQPDGPPPIPNVELEGHVGEVLARGLERDPDARWESCEAMVRALRSAIVRDTPPLVITPPGEARTRPGSWWRRSLLYGAGAVGVVAAIALGRTVWNGPETVAVGLSSSTVAPGTVVVVSAVNLPAGQSGTVMLLSQPVRLGTFRANAQGEVHVRVTIPLWTPPGEHHVRLCWRATCQGNARLSVLALPAPSASPPRVGGPGTPPTSSPRINQVTAPPPPPLRSRPVRTSPGGHAAPPAPAPMPAPAPTSPTPAPPPRPSPTPAPTPPPTSTPAPSPPPTPHPTPSATTPVASPSVSAPSTSPTA
jgi:hypothetical protein